MYSTGSLCHQAVDFSIDGLMPCQFGRVYRSLPAANSPLGYGWYWPWDITVSLDGDELVYRAMGGLVEERFRLQVGVNGLIHSQTAATLFVARDEIRVTLPSDRIYYFAFPTTFQPLGPLQSIRDLLGNACYCVSSYGYLREMTDANGRHYRVIRDLEQRITGIELADGVPGFPRRLVSYEYDRRGDLTRVTDRCGAQCEYRYDDHLMVAFRNRTGGWYYAEYDAERRCIRTWRSDGRITKTYRHDPVGHQLMIEDAEGYGTLIRLDEQSRLLEQVDPVGVRTTMIYAQQGSLVGTMSNTGFSSTVSVTRNDQKSETRMCGADGCEYTVTTDPTTREEVIANCVGAKWMRKYDEAGNLIESITPGGAVCNYEYDSRGQLTAATLPGGNRVQYIYSADYRRLEVVDAIGSVGNLEWDEESRLVRRQMPECNPDFYRYDALGRVIEIVRPNGASLRFQLDAEGQCTSAITETGDRRDAEWSPFGELVSGLDALGTRFRLDYDELGRQVLVTNAAGETLQMEYDQAGRLASQVFFDETVERYSYDHRGFLNAIAYPDGTSKKFKFDAAGRVVEVSDRQHSLCLDYDARGYPVKAIRDGVSVQYEYDLEGHQTLEIQDGVTIARQFDLSGNCLSLSVDHLGVRRFQYDARQRPVAITDFNDGQLIFEYDLRDRIRRVSLGPDLGLEYEYLPENRISRTRLWNANESREARYGYDLAGRITSRQGPGPSTLLFDYRPDGYLGQMSVNGGGFQPLAYTTCGDLIVDAVDQAIVYSTGGRVRSAGDRSYEYDERGRVVQIREGNQKHRLSYDHLDALIRIDSAAKVVAEYQYDALGRRTRKVTPTDSTKFVWDGAWLLAEIQSDSSRTRTYVGSGWRVFYSLADGATERAELFLTDLNGLPLAAASRSAIAVTHRADVWGQTAGSPLNLPIRLAGQYQDGESGFYYNRYRYYDPRLRRYLTPDPLRLEGAVNLYAYQTDPVNSIDPYGLATVVAQEPCKNAGPAQQKENPPTTKQDDPGCSPGDSIHNDCITMTRNRADAPGLNYSTRADQTMTTGQGRNRPDLTLAKPGQQNVYIEWDNPPCSRATDHYNKICDADPGALVFLVTLNKTYGTGPGQVEPGPTTPGNRTKNSKMGKGANLKPDDCGINAINTELNNRGMTQI